MEKFITHYSRGEPFRSLTALAPNELASALAALTEKNAWGLGRFAQSDYLPKRRKVEARLRQAFLERDGNPLLPSPIYFFLGRSASFESHPLNIGYQIELAHLTNNSITFTYGDSLLALDSEFRKTAGEKYANPLCQDIYLQADLTHLLSHENFDPSLHIEAQLWVMPPREHVQTLARG